MTTPGAGLAFHVHHDRLVEWCYDFDERVRYILEEKPIEEQPIRLERFQPVKGPLPASLAQVLHKVDLNISRSSADRWKAIAGHMPELIALHEQECKECPWDGYTIFPSKKKEQP